MPVYAFGVLATVVYAIVAGLWVLPLAAGLSYVPYLGYGVIRHRARLRVVRHVGVFALLWLVLCFAATAALLAGAQVSAAGGAIRAFGVDVFQPALLITPLVALLLIVGNGEAVLFLIGRLRPPRDEEPAPVRPGHRLLVAGLALLFVSGSTCGYLGVLGALAQPRWEGGAIDADRERRTPRALLRAETEAAPGVEALTAAGCSRGYVVTPAMVTRYRSRSGEDDVAIPEIHTVTCLAYPGPSCESVATAYASAIGSTADVGVDRRSWSDTDRSACSGVFTSEGVRVRDLRDEEVAFSLYHPRSRR